MKIQCECGAVQANISGLPGSAAGRFVCYCDDCQAFAHSLGSADRILDRNGGSEIVPVYPWSIEFAQGRDLIRCRRLGPKGLFRFYASCCQTPIANSLPRLPWAGVAKAALPSEAEREKALGPIRGRLMGKFSVGRPPQGTAEKIGAKELFAIAPFLLLGLVKRRGRPSPFFDAQTGQPLPEPETLSKGERNRLRSLCGPR